jgi:hypothetical protein
VARRDSLGVKIGAEHTQRAVYVNQIGPALVEFPFQFDNKASQPRALGDQPGNRVIVHAARFRCQ